MERGARRPLWGETERFSVPSIDQSEVSVEIQRRLQSPRKLPNVERDTDEVAVQRFRTSRTPLDMHRG